MSARDQAEGMGNLNTSKAGSLKASLTQSAYVEKHFQKEQKRKQIIKIAIAVVVAIALIVLIVVLATSGGDDSKVDPIKPDDPTPHIDPVDPQPIGPVDPVDPQPVDPVDPPVGPDDPPAPEPPAPIPDPSIQELEATQMIEALQKEIDFSRYKFQGLDDKFSQIWKSTQFGGPVTGPIKKPKKDSEDVEVVNNLVEEMRKVKSVKDTQNGFFTINFAREDDVNNDFIDMQIQVFNLTDSEYDLLDNFQIQSSTGKFDSDEAPLFQEQILPILNGYGRLIKYDVTGFDEMSEMDPTKFEENIPEWVMEGRFVKGKLNGYGRIIYEKKIEVGFFEDGKLYGKGIIFPNDEKKPDLAVAEGLFDHSSTVAEDFEISDFMENKLPNGKEEPTKPDDEKKFLH